MKYKLIAPVQQNYSPVEQVLHNRGIEDINKYLKSSIKDINSPHELNSIQLRNGLAMLAYHIARNDKTAIIILSDHGAHMPGPHDILFYQEKTIEKYLGLFLFISLRFLIIEH